MKDVFTGALGAIAIPLCFGIIAVLYWFFGRNIEIAFLPAISLALYVLPLFLPVILFYLTYDRWMEFVRTMFYYKMGRTTLRIKLPPEVLKSPEAMESVFTYVFAPMNPDNLSQGYLDGKGKLPISLELASIGGEVRFYINVPTKLKDMMESQLYSQYPGIEVEEELLDYASELLWDPEKMDMMGFHVVKKEDGIYPIKTYIEFGHDRLPKEEEKFEPMAALIEFMAKAKPHERVFIQILCIPHAKENFNNGYRSERGTWEKDAQKAINEKMGRDDRGQSTAEETESRPMLTGGERDTITAIERNISKVAYDVGIRTMYVTLDKTQFNPQMIAPTFGAFTQYSVTGRNALGPRWKTDFDNSWYEDISGGKKLARKKQEVEHFKLRKYQADGAGDAMKTMSVEELATIFHIPGSSVLTPGLSRIASKRQNAPGNLPVGELPF
jgi:hypothetical protein